MRYWVLQDQIEKGVDLFAVNSFRKTDQRGTWVEVEIARVPSEGKRRPEATYGIRNQAEGA